MPLQSSGAISLANIQSEFGGTNPISISEYYAGGGYVPSGASGTNGAIPSSGTISFSQFYGTSLGGSNYITAFSAAGSTLDGINVNSLNQVFVGARVNDTQTSGFYALKLNSSGQLVNTTQVTATSNLRLSTIRNTNIDNSSNFYIYGTREYSTVNGGLSGGCIAKFNSNANNAGSNLYYSSTSLSSSITASDNDSLNYPYILGWTANSSGGYNTFLTKLDNTTQLTTVWQRRLGASTTTDDVRGQSLAIDYLDNVYAVIIRISGSTRYFYIGKWNSSGTSQQWLLRYYIGPSSSYVTDAGILNNDIGVDGAGNIYIIARKTSSPIELQLAKLDSAGTLQWQRSIAVSGTNYQSITVDTNGNSYLSFRTSTTNTHYVLKYNSSGVIQWQRQISIDATNGTIALNNSGTNYYILLSNYVLSLPTDGSKTGTYTNPTGGTAITYEASSLTESAGTGGVASTSIGDGTVTYTLSSITNYQTDVSTTATTTGI